MVSNNEKNPPRGRLAACAREGFHMGLYQTNVTTSCCVNVNFIGGKLN